jgi:hypothetical protein
VRACWTVSDPWNAFATSWVMTWSICVHFGVGVRGSAVASCFTYVP